jgi:hypothetical protein
MDSNPDKQIQNLLSYHLCGHISSTTSLPQLQIWRYSLDGTLTFRDTHGGLDVILYGHKADMKREICTSLSGL